MWKAHGGDPARQPANWLASADARRFIDVLAEINPGNSGDELVKSVRGGKSRGTWANWQIGLAYAKYLSRIEYRGQPVMTTEQLAAAYEVDEKCVHTNRARNASRFIEGVDFFDLRGADLKGFKNSTSNRWSVGAKANALILWTERDTLISRPVREPRAPARARGVA